ncbi:hypothetical protein [Flavisolibacter tropicus]|uniref:Uncharacterized protein n=1 Tax=Flavisolibacter tropicus TaxID=1492898 RepID=A0A172U0C1_9BACT|nr:hypothetical protein [Flavisolibacter tropicus]ANE52706.1 hypothetical protein SY85_21735 [Flavisolibacter tropicus]
MTHRKFCSLTKKQKKTALLKTGVFLAERKLGFFKAMLYQVNNFYVEVFFLKWSKNAIGFRTFTAVKSLQPYLRTIDLSTLLQNLYVKP